MLFSLFPLNSLIFSLAGVFMEIRFIAVFYCFLFKISSMCFVVVGFLIGAPFGSSLGVSFWGTFEFLVNFV